MLKDLCARLPYGVKIQYDIYGIQDLTIDKLNAYIKGSKNIKPYLRPISNMDEEEILEFYKIVYDTWYSDSLYYRNNEWISFRGSIKNNNLCFINCIWLSDINKVTDYLNKKMFDYRGLIPKDLALSTEIYNPYNIKA